MRIELENRTNKVLSVSVLIEYNPVHMKTLEAGFINTDNAEIDVMKIKINGEEVP